MAAKTRSDKKPTNATASNTKPLGADELRRIHAWWRACNYLSVGMIYLRGNPLVKEPLKIAHVWVTGGRVRRCHSRGCI